MLEILVLLVSLNLALLKIPLDRVDSFYVINIE